MIERLGNVIYWACTAIAGLLVIGLGGGGYLNSGNPEIFIIVVPMAIVVWLCGRAVLYVLAGR